MASIRLSPAEVASVAERDSRCVECSSPKSRHGADLACPGSGKTKFSTMDLPAGKTCGDCRHIRTCRGLGFTAGPHMTSCDFFPVRFSAKVATPA